MEELLKFYSDDGPERCGLILSDGQIIELTNTADEPLEGFEISGEDLIKYEDEAVASWHTHPGEGSQLSVEDMEGFLSYPDIQHHIIGNDGLSSYAVMCGKVIIRD